MDSQHWPRVLVLSDEGPHMKSAGGILLYRLFEDCPPERLRAIARRVPLPPDRLACSYAALETPWRRFEQSRFNRSKRSLRALGLVPPVPRADVDRHLAGFEPEVVVCVMQHAAYYDCAWRFARQRRIPLVVIVHDVNDEFEPVLPFARAAARRRDGAFYRFAARRLCVSPEMESLCRQKYGAAGDVLYPNRDVGLGPRDPDASRELRSASGLTVGFVGNLNYGYGDELMRLLPAFRASGARLVLFSNPPGGQAAALLDEACCDFRGFMPAHEAWRQVKRDCDAVILPYPNPAGAMETLYRHHFPSKLPEYLALGMPVVITGPQYATGVRWGMDNPHAAVVCTDPSPSGLVDQLDRLRVDADWRVALARGALDAGARDFDPAAIKAAFLNHLREAARGS